MATRNHGKFREYQALLAHLPFSLTNLDHEGIEVPVEEVGRNYCENAVLKAKAYARASGFLTLADDSGLEVDALDGAPGPFSSRYAPSDEKRIKRLLFQLEGIPEERRTARFRCTIALATPQGETWTAEGNCAGLIALAPAGEQGFGYDPIFYLPEYKKTMAELEPEVKNEISHRARATRAIWSILEKIAKLNRS